MFQVLKVVATWSHGCQLLHQPVLKNKPNNEIMYDTL